MSTLKSKLMAEKLMADMNLRRKELLKEREIDIVKATLLAASNECANLHKIGGMTVLFAAERVARIDPNNILESMK